MKNRYLKHYYGLKFSHFFFFNNLYLLVFSEKFFNYLPKKNKLIFIFCKRYQFFFNLKIFFNFYSKSFYMDYLCNLLKTVPTVFIMFFNVEFSNLILILNKISYFCAKKLIHFILVLYENYLIYVNMFAKIVNKNYFSLFFFLKNILFKIFYLLKLKAI